MDINTEGTSALKPPPLPAAQPMVLQEIRYTYADYKTWPEDQRWELIDGVPFAMSPAPYRKHQDFVWRLCQQVGRFFEGKACKPYSSPIDVFWEALDNPNQEDTITQPDILVVCDKSKLVDRGIKGAPDFIIEVLSSSTAYKDQTNKRMLHEKHGVREYWIVNPDTFETFIYVLKDGIYGLPRIVDIRNPTPVQIFEGLELFVREEDV